LVVRFMRAAPCWDPRVLVDSMVAARGALSTCVRQLQPPPHPLGESGFEDFVGALFLKSRFVEVTSGIPAHPARARGARVGQASDVARVAASVTTIVLGHAPLHSFSMMPPVGSGAHMENLAPRQLPNKRLKLAGGDRFKGNGVLCPGGHGLSSNDLAPAGESPAA